MNNPKLQLRPSVIDIGFLRFVIDEKSSLADVAGREERLKLEKEIATAERILAACEGAA